jgi:integrase
VPADRIGTKVRSGRKALTIPLCDRAVEILRELRRRHEPRDADLIFPSDRPGVPLSGAAMGKLLERMGRDDIVPHGFRSTFKDWCAEQTNFANHLSEAALWHVVADKVEAAYRRGEMLAKRKRLMGAWARYCAMPTAAGEVVLLRKVEGEA